MVERCFDMAIIQVRFLLDLPKTSLVWLCCNGSNLDCDSGSTGSNPVSHPKEVLCPTGQIGKVNSLKRRSSLCSNQRWGTKLL